MTALILMGTLMIRVNRVNDAIRHVPFCRKRLQDLAENLQQMEEAREELAKQHQQQLQQQRYLQSARFVFTLIEI